MKVALAYYWLVGMRGVEKVLEELCRLYPNADIYTHVAIPDNLSDTIRAHTEMFAPNIFRDRFASSSFVQGCLQKEQAEKAIVRRAK